MGDSWIWIGALLAVAVAIVLVVAARSRGGAAKSPGRIVFIQGPREGDVVELISGRTRIGALDDNDIVIPSKQVSRYHAELRVRGRRVHIWDLKARNLTYVNGESVSSRELKSGDVITIGDAQLRYER